MCIMLLKINTELTNAYVQIQDSPINRKSWSSESKKFQLVEETFLLKSICSKNAHKKKQKLKRKKKLATAARTNWANAV